MINVILYQVSCCIKFWHDKVEYSIGIKFDEYYEVHLIRVPNMVPAVKYPLLRVVTSKISRNSLV
jgi:hypothetical protein